MSRPALGEWVLSARDLRVVRQGRTIVQVAELGVEPGEVHVLLGANGAGKSTLLKALNGLEPAEGLLEFRGWPVRTASDRLALRRETSAVFQKSYLLATSVRNNVASGLRLRGARRDVARRQADGAMQLLGIEHLAGRRPEKLSGGEAQRVSIARALAVDPAVLFLDEPLAALDPPTRRGLLADLVKIFAGRAMGVFWVTHDRDEALAVSHRTSFLDAGRVVQTGPTGHAFAHPATASFASFLGLDAYLNGEVIVGDGLTRLRLDGGAEIMCAEAPPGSAVACLPPEDVVLFSEPPPPGSTSLRNVLPGFVKSMSPAGRLLLVAVETPACEVAALVTPAAADELVLGVGAPVVAAFKAAAVHPIPVLARSEKGS